VHITRLSLVLPIDHQFRQELAIPNLISYCVAGNAINTLGLQVCVFVWVMWKCMGRMCDGGRLIPMVCTLVLHCV